MKSSTRLFGLVVIVSVMGASEVMAVVLAQYDAMGAAQNPNTQGWSWNGTGNVGVGGAALLLNGAANPAQLFTETVPVSAFNAPWSFTGNIRLAGNGQEEYGRMFFVDDGTNIWHISFLNAGNDATDGIYNGGDPNGPVLDNTATKIWAEPVPAKPFDGFHDYSIVDPDGAGGVTPQFYVDGSPVTPAVSLLAEPSRFAAGTIGFGSLNPNESGFFQTTRMVFEGVPEPSSWTLAGISLLALARRSRHARKR
jgi:hypothetical protein